ncbi:hypothetical protein BDY21DRAFT_1558 [Lineolata rhizophorae]|uniref:Uncharacterized protein n=1 Tax=Lineolata rhizophorae TaxID=578093 RepID=A0A6A6PDE1_9PEZI|nr:hypothetical protein BDY21DRAFT_1558 [Lineolata rhizophorae]
MRSNRHSLGSKPGMIKSLPARKIGSHSDRDIPPVSISSKERKWEKWLCSFGPISTSQRKRPLRDARSQREHDLVTDSATAINTELQRKVELYETYLKNLFELKSAQESVQSYGSNWTERSLPGLVEGIRDRLRELDDLQKRFLQLSEDKSQWEYYSQSLQADRDRVFEDKNRLNQQLKLQKAQFENDKLALQEAKNSELATQRLDAAKTMEDMRHNHNKEREKYTEERKKYTEENKVRIQSLEAALLNTSHRFQPVPDSLMKGRFIDLKNQVISISRTVTWSHADTPSVLVGNTFNLSKFVSTAPKKDWKYAVEYAFWSILIDHFFSVPFGAKALGRSGEDCALALCSTFRNLFHPKPDNPLEPSSFTIAAANHVTEKWRSVTFETIRESLTDDGRCDAAHAGIMRDYDDNFSAACRRITEELQVSAEDADRQIRATVKNARSLALDFGVQRFRWEIFLPKQGDFISADDCAFRDINGANSNRKDKGMVQIAVRPGLRRRGDGQGGLTSTVTDVEPALVYLD